VEKILAPGEELPPDWPVCGTTGYDFLTLVNEAFVDPQGLRSLSDLYQSFTGVREEFSEFAYRGNKYVLEQLFAGELRAISHAFGHLAARDRRGRDVPLSEYTQALIEVTACLPVYRTYVCDFRISGPDRKYIEQAIAEARRRTLDDRAGPPAFDFLRRVLLLEVDREPEDERQEWLRFLMRWQQFTGAAMAKGFEDTALYNYHRLDSLNDVGGNPGTAGLPLEDFHRALKSRLDRMPHTLNASSTHDTKRSEDVRARLNVLSELPHDWGRHLQKWSRLNAPRKPTIQGRPVPDPNEEIFIYQTLLGAWPLTAGEWPVFPERMKQYFVKALREAKTHSAWLHPDEAYEGALVQFVETLLSLPPEDAFRRDFERFQARVAFYGAWNSLSQTLLKIMAPGVPDFYQGTELWDFKLVDPDNRRPVDFTERIRLLEELRHREGRGAPALVRELVEHWADGRIKLYLIHKALEFRKAFPDLFLDGEYIPIEVNGLRKAHVCAFARRHGQLWCVVVVSRLIAKFSPPGKFPLGKEAWNKTTLAMPKAALKHWVDVLTQQSCSVTPTPKGNVLPVEKILRSFSVALLVGRPRRRTKPRL
jgi:(1->4)-alpha-D-glucan 1-alpha-D-glucosylmutase